MLDYLNEFRYTHCCVSINAYTNQWDTPNNLLGNVLTGMEQLSQELLFVSFLWLGAAADICAVLPDSIGLHKMSYIA